uniref:Uncharacterized protein n=1 Tax=Entomoneis paludosa TaxID=265537 RepID=A0A7S3DV23_9STRA
MALWTKPTQKTITSESSGPAIRRSSSWKDCRKLVSAITSDRKTRIRSTRLVPRREPLSQGMMYKSASRPAAAMSSPSAMTSRSARRSSLDRLGPVDFAESPSTKKLDNKKKKKKTASTSSKHSISTKIITHPQPEEAEKVPSPKASTKQTVRVPASKSLTSPFPMQFRDRSTPQSPSGSNETITAVEVDISSNLEIKTSEESGQSGPSAPPIPPPPPSSRSGAPTLIPEMETIDSNEFIYRTETSSPTSLASKQKIDASNKTDLPPTCPSTSSRKVVTHKPKRKKKKHDRIAKWKAQQSARQTSIMDDEVDDDDDDDISSGSESETDEESDEVGVVASPIASVE